jgi:hypothetical protein
MNNEGNMTPQNSIRSIKDVNDNEEDESKY